MNGHDDLVIEALRIIAAKAPPDISSEAAKSMLSNNELTRQMRLNRLAPRMLYEGTLTDEEREIVADAISLEGGRDYTLRIRLSSAERLEIEAMAEAAGLSMSEYVRRRIFAIEI